MKCSVEGCEREICARGWCRKHYSRWHRGLPLHPTPRRRPKPKVRLPCAWATCDRLVQANGYCAMHNERAKRGAPMDAPPRRRIPGDTCSVTPCGEPHLSGGYCKRHYNIRKVHRVDPQEWQDRFEAQGRACKVCRTTDPGGKWWHTDHDHACCPDYKQSCGECFRGVLCGRCNAALGYARDDVEILRGLAAYLTEWQRSRT